METEQVVQYKYARYDGRGRLKPYTRNNPEFKPRANGGVTVAVVVGPDGGVGVGLSVCQQEDTFDYDVGRRLAFGRAWDDYRKGIIAKARKATEKAVSRLFKVVGLG